jgi:hypothetical protein
MRSHTRADRAEDASAGARHVAEIRLTRVKGKEKKNEVGAKRKADEMKFDEQDASSAEKTGKRARKKESEHRAYINPFIPEPSLTVAEHEAHSQALSQAQRVVPPSDPDPSTDGHSLFSQSLASTYNKDTLPAPSKASSSALKPRSQTPARPILVLALLPPPKSKTITKKLGIPLLQHLLVDRFSYHPHRILLCQLFLTQVSFFRPLHKPLPNHSRRPSQLC